MKKKLFLCLAVVLVCMYSQGVLQAAVVDVSMVNFRFEPKTVTINVGDTVRWTNNGTVQHTTTSGTGCTSNGTWNSGLLPPGQTFSFVFNTAGSYPYFCIPHCVLGMTGTVTVQGQGTTTITSTSTVFGTTTTTTVTSTTTTAGSTTTTTARNNVISNILGIPPEVVLSMNKWPLANKDYSNTRATTCSRINSRNVNRLRVAWTFDIPGISVFGAAATNPLIVGNRVYLQDLKSNVYALSLRNGRMIWKKDYNVDNIGPTGPAVGWGKIFVPVQPNIVALDRQGNELWSQKITTVDTEGIDFQLTAFADLVYVSTVPGSSVTNFYTGGAAGIIYALDQKTGEIKWHFDTVDTSDIWGNPLVNSGGGAWYPPAIDLRTGITYWGIANPAPYPGTPEFPNGTSRPGPNLYSDSIVALDARSGALQWYNQLKPHDLYDLDFQCSPILATARMSGMQMDIVIGGGKLGKVFAFDRATGDILWQTKVGKHENDELTEFPAGITTRVYPGIFGGVETNMALADGVVYVPVVNIFTDFTPTSVVQDTINIAGGTGELVAIDINTGEILWDKEFSSPNFGGATVVNDLVFTATFDGKIYAFDRRTGDEKWTYQASGGINAWPAVTGNTIIFPVGQGNPPQLIAFKIGF